MNNRRYLIVERDEAETYLLLSLVSFAATVIGVRFFLQVTGYPQVGGSTFHIAHLLWGGLALFIAVLLILILDNPRALKVAAILSGIGIGLFIDEVGKFITQSNDYFFPAAAPIIYGFFLLTVVLYLIIRKPEPGYPPRAMVRALEDLQDVIYKEFETEDLEQLHARLKLASQSSRPYIAQMAMALQGYVEQTELPVREDKPGWWKRLTTRIKAWSLQQGERKHRLLIVAGLIVIALTSISLIGGLIWVAVSPTTTARSFLLDLLAEAENASVDSHTLYLARLFLETAVGLMAIIAIIILIRGHIRKGITFALTAVILALTAIQLLTFYLDQFTAVLPTLYQFGLLLVIITYQRWHVNPGEALKGDVTEPEPPPAD